MKLHHLGIACLDLDEATAALESQGFGRPSGPDVDDPQQRARLRLLRSPDGTLLELVQGPVVEGLLKKGIALYHTCWEVESLEEQGRLLEAAGGMPLSPPAPAPMFNGRRVAFYRTAAGLVELLESAR